MKTTPILALALAALLTTGSVFAEEDSQTKTALEESGNKLSSTLTLGYDSQNILYGYRSGHSLWHADIWLVYQLNNKLFLNGGSWLGIQFDGKYRELDGYLGLDYALTDAIIVGLQYSLYGYLEVPFETSDEVSEYAAHISYWGANCSLQLRNQYDREAKGSLIRIIGGYTTPLLEKLSLKLDAEAGYALEYFIEGNLWNHALLKVTLPYQVSDSFSVEPFIAHSIPLAAIDSFENDETYGGINASFTF
jgi:hypothetical protein